MAESLKSLLGEDAPQRLATLLHRAWSRFDRKAFTALAMPGYPILGLMARGERMADALEQTLPADFERAAAILSSAMDPPLPMDARGEPCSDGRGYSAFLYLPYSIFISRHGLEHFEAAMDAQHALTQRFTAEFSIRPFLVRHPAATLARLAQWTADPSGHVRRLVSEGTRPRLPWARRLPALVADPSPGLALLEHLRDDPSRYVRRSVANHLGDVGKDHPQRLLALAGRWMSDAPPLRVQLLRHALRTLVRRGDPDALSLLGSGHSSRLSIRSVSWAPARPHIGDNLVVTLALHNPEAEVQTALVNLEIGYVKANGQLSPRTFSLGNVALASGGVVTLRKQLSLRQMTTRTHYPGLHTIALQLNGRRHPLGDFFLDPSPLTP